MPAGTVLEQDLEIKQFLKNLQVTDDVKDDEWESQIKEGSDKFERDKQLALQFQAEHTPTTSEKLDTLAARYEKRLAMIAEERGVSLEKVKEEMRDENQKTLIVELQKAGGAANNSVTPASKDSSMYIPKNLWDDSEHAKPPVVWFDFGGGLYKMNTQTGAMNVTLPIRRKVVDALQSDPTNTDLEMLLELIDARQSYLKAKQAHDLVEHGKQMKLRQNKREQALHTERRRVELAGQRLFSLSNIKSLLGAIK